VGVGTSTSNPSPNSSRLNISLPMRAFKASRAENNLPSMLILEALLRSYASCAS
jgi:hypothetical protein